MKDLNLLKRYIKYQETSYNFRLGFALSNRPHLHRAYVVTVYNQNFIAVYAICKTENLGYPFHWMCVYTENDLRPHLYFKHGMQVGDKFWIFDSKVMEVVVSGLPAGTKSWWGYRT